MDSSSQLFSSWFTTHNCMATELSLPCTPYSWWILTIPLPAVWVWVWVLYYNQRSAGQCLGIKHPSGAYNQIFITVRQLQVCWYGVLSLTEDGFVIYNCCWPSTAQSFLVPSPVGLATIFYCLRFETSLYFASYNSQGYVEVFDPADRHVEICLRNLMYRVSPGLMCSTLTCMNSHPCSLIWIVFNIIYGGEN
jgi:hypothetical protein